MLNNNFAPNDDKVRATIILFYEVYCYAFPPVLAMFRQSVLYVHNSTRDDNVKLFTNDLWHPKILTPSSCIIINHLFCLISNSKYYCGPCN
jgi:hypothetical protein